MEKEKANTKEKPQSTQLTMEVAIARTQVYSSKCIVNLHTNTLLLIYIP